MQNVPGTHADNAKRLLVGLVGHGPALEALAAVMGKSNFAAAFPKVKIAGWALAGAADSKKGLSVPPVFKNVPRYPDILSLFTARPGISVAVDLSSDSAHMATLRALAPADVSIGSADLLLRFCAAADDGRLAIGGGENLRKAERLFALLVDQMNEDIFILDETGGIIDANRHAAASRGLTPGELTGKNCADLDRNGTPYCLDTDNASPFQQALSTGKQTQHTFVESLDNGRVRYIHALCFPVADTLGGPARYLYIRRDVTEQRQLEQRLQQTEKMAAIGELSTFMAHEIRNPLFSIGGFANALLRNTSLNDLAREKARIIYDESRRLDLILTNIVNFARPTEQTMGVFDASVVIKQTLELMTLGSEERGLSVVVDLEGLLPSVRGNAENLKQCLINLIKNAMEAMPEGGTLTVLARRKKDFVRISVSDTGPGILPHLHEQIFSPFFSTKHGGAGLGLAMTRKVIKEMGGEVDLESQPESGTTVSLTLPVALSVDEEDSSLPGSTGRAFNDSTQADQSVAARPGPAPRPRKGPDEDPYA